eukprot:8220025-Karenia_brevis.AAC.1
MSRRSSWRGLQALQRALHSRIALRTFEAKSRGPLRKQCPADFRRAPRLPAARRAPQTLALKPQAEYRGIWRAHRAWKRKKQWKAVGSSGKQWKA